MLLYSGQIALDGAELLRARLSQCSGELVYWEVGGDE
jgi:hypothetical protein